MKPEGCHQTLSFWVGSGVALSPAHAGNEATPVLGRDYLKGTLISDLMRKGQLYSTSSDIPMLISARNKVTPMAPFTKCSIQPVPN